ncbi:MAG: hypothetical protein ACOCTM_04730 [Bacteroidota bacterium]
MSKNEVAEKKQDNKEVAKLGDGEVFVKQTDDGFIKAVKGIVKLSEKKGHLTEIKGRTTITAAGYYELNKIPGISVITPSSLTLPNGDNVVNPYPITDKESESISKVWVKKLGVGLSPIGNMVITSSTLLYDIRMYFVQDLFNKVKKNKDAGRICTEDMLSQEEKEEGIFQKFEGKMGVWGDVDHPEVLKALKTFINNKLFAERKAQTIAERNVLKKHPALSKTYVDPQGPRKARTARVPVIGYTHDLGQEDLEEISEKASEKDEGEIEVAGRKAKIIDVGGEVEEEDVIAADEDIAPEEAPEDNSSPPNGGGNSEGPQKNGTDDTSGPQNYKRKGMF